MTLIKNCYAGEMAKTADSGSQFFSSLSVKTPAFNYCYNSLITIEHRTTDALVHIRVLKDSKDGQFHAYHYTLPRDAVKKGATDTPALALQGLKGECFTSSPEGCGGGILKTIGWTDMDVPLVVAIGRAADGHFILTRMVQNRADIDLLKPKELAAMVENDSKSLTGQLLQEIRRKVVGVARLKLSSMRSGTSAKKLADESEQFRYCSMAMEGFLKDKKLSDPFSPEEKMSLATLTNYLNGDANAPATMQAKAGASSRAGGTRGPASVSRGAVSSSPRSKK